MSTTIDQRVVEMRFDNKQFEANVKTSLSTLDKLKQKLNLTGASKGLENINNAAKHHNLGVLGDAAYQVGLKFNGMYTIADQALRNITNSVQRTATNMVSALTIDPIKTGLQEYETQIGAVQTIMANTSHQGTTLNDVNQALDTLNTYADKTIYNFTEMTRNIGTFTAAGVDLQTSVDSIQGIANLAAVSGSTSQQASTAMYQLSQALAAGKVSLMDWNSVVNAGMGGKVFQDALIRTSELLGTGADAAIKTYGSFRESLTQGEWLTTEVLTETLKQFAGAYSEADLIAQGFTKDQAKSIAEMAVTAQDAATKVKTLTQLWDTLKEAAQSGWTQTWELIIGDFEEAKELWSGVSDVIGEFINGMSESRNNLLAGALNSPWEKLIEKVNEAGVSTDEFQNKVREVSKTRGIDLDEVIEKYGSFEKACRSGAISSAILSKALKDLSGKTLDLSNITKNLKMGDSGEDVKKVQQALKDLGVSNFDGFGIDGIIGEETTAAIKAFQEAKGLDVTGIVDEATIQALEKANENTANLYKSCSGLLGQLDEFGGRELIIEGFKNAFKALVRVLQPIKAAFRDIFPPASSDSLKSIIEGFVDFTEKLKPSMETVRNIHDTFEGFFSILDIGLMIIKAVGEGIGKAFGGSGLGNIAGSFLKVTAAIGRFVTKLRDALKAGDTFGSISDIIAAGIRKLLDIASIPADIIAGFVNGLSGGAGAIVSAAIDMVSKFLQTIKDFLGIHSPSTETYDIAWNCILGIVNGIKAGINLVVGAVGEIAQNILAAFGLDWGKLLSIGLSGGFIYTAKKLFDIIGAFASPLEGFSDILNNAGETVDIFNGILKKTKRSVNKVIKNFAKIEKSFGKMIKAKAWDLRATALLKFAGAIGILAASLALLTLVDQGKLKSAVGALSVMMIVMGGFAFAVSKLMTITSIADAAAIALLGNLLIKLGIAIGIMGLTIKLIGSMDPLQMGQGLAAVAVLMLFMKAFAEIGANSAGKNAGKLGGLLLKMSISLLILVGVCKLIGMLTPEEILGGIMALVVFGSFVAFMAEFTAKAGDNVGKFGRMMLSMSIAMLLMVGVVKLLGMMSLPEIIQGGIGILAFVGIMALLVTVVKSAGKDIPKIAGVLIAMSAAMLIMTGVVAIMGKMELATMIKGAIGILAFVGIMALMVEIVKRIEKDAPKVAATLIAMSVAIGILAGVAIIMSLIDPIALLKGVAAVGALTLIFSVAAKASRGVQEAKGTFIGMAVAIGVMAAAVALLTLVDGEKLAGATLALSILMATFSLIAKSSKQIDGAWKSLIVMTVAVGVLAGVLYLLAKLPIDKTIGTAVALGVLLVALSASLNIMSKSGSHATKALPAMGIMVLVVGGLAVILGVLSALNVQPSIETALSLSILLLAMSAACLILGAVGKTGTAAITGAGVLMGVVAIIGVVAMLIGGLMSLIPTEKIEEWKNGLQSFMDFIIILAGGLGEAIGAFVGGAIGGSLEAFSTQLNTLADSVSAFSTKISGIDESALNSVTSLGEMIAMITGASILDGINSFVTGTSSMETFKTNVIAFADAMNELSEKLTSGNINTEAISAVATAGGLFAELQNALPKTGGVWQEIAGVEDLGLFGDKVKAFADALLKVNESVSGEGFSVNTTALTGLATAGTKFSELQNTLPKTGGLWQEIAGAKDIGTFGEKIKAFADAVVEVNNSVSGEGFAINEAAMTALATAGTKFSELQNSLPKSGGLWQEIAGAEDIGVFGGKIKAFADAVIEVNKSISGEGFTINEAAINAMVTAGTKFNELQSSLPKTGGWWQEVAGAEDIGTFGEKVAAFGKAMAGFKTSIGEGLDEAAVTSVQTAGLMMTELQNAIPTDKWLDGKVSLDTFGTKIESFGSSLTTFSTTLADFKSDVVSKAITQANRLVTFANDVSDLDTTGLWMFADISLVATAMKGYSDTIAEMDTSVVSSSISSANRLKNFINSLVDLDNSGVSNFQVEDIGTAMESYSSSVADMDPSVVSSSISAANRLKNFIASLAELDSSGISKFKLDTIASAMQSYIASVSGMNPEAVSASISAANRLKNLINGLANIDASGVDSFISAVSKLCNLKVSDLKIPDLSGMGSDIIESIIRGVNSKSSSMTTSIGKAVNAALKSINEKREGFKTAGIALMSMFISGIAANVSKISTPIIASLASAVAAIRVYYTSFKSAGQYLGDGLIAGINAKKQAAYDAGYALGQKAVQGEKDGQKSNSPSKLTEQAGEWLGEGLVIGMGNMVKSVYKSGKNLGQTAANSMTSTVSKIATAINTDIDSQPTIRPVLDLSDVQSGASRIGSLLSGDHSLAFGTNMAGTIAANMNSRQNGTSMDDVVSAIDKLRNNLSNNSGNTYQVGGVTYDDGSNVATAVKSLIRAAKIDRRA